jgi:hypothetical protein
VRLFFCLLLLISSDGCALISDLTRQRPSETNERRCSAPPEQVEVRKIPLAVFEHRSADRLVRESIGRMPTSFSWRAIQTAQVIDVFSLLNQFEILEERSINSASDAHRLQAVH